MSAFEDLLIHEVDIVNVTEDLADEDRYGDPDEDTTTIADEPARVEGVSADEIETDRDTRITRFLVFLRAGTDVRATSKIVWDGHTHEVFGHPETLNDRTGPHHIELTMDRIEG